ncbi:MAG: hypothetical protein KDK48_00365, partial [Chlamydiia bacterium]|nr:hypothetical protein [Chlamydiia bacterium]
MISLLILSTALNAAGFGVVPKAPNIEQAVGSIPAKSKADNVAQNDPAPLKKQKKKVNPLRTNGQQSFKPVPKAPVATCPAPCEPVCTESCDPPKARQRGLMWAPIVLVAGGVAAACVSAIHSGQD